MLIDSHCHLHDPAFADLRETLRLSMAHDVYGIVAVGCDPASNELTLAAGGGRAQVGLRLPGISPGSVRARRRGPSSGSRRRSPRTSRAWPHRRDRPAVVLARGRGRSGHAHERAARALDRHARCWPSARISRGAPRAARRRGGRAEALKRHGIERAVFHWHKAPAEVTRPSSTPATSSRSRRSSSTAIATATSSSASRSRPCSWRATLPGSTAASSTAPPSGPWLAAAWPKKWRSSSTCRSRSDVPALANACRLFDLDSRRSRSPAAR